MINNNILLLKNQFNGVIHKPKKKYIFSFQKIYNLMKLFIFLSFDYILSH